MPGATVGLQSEDATIAELLKPLGYATGQFGKNHLGDQNEFLPTVHGFDEFFGNLYHLNAEEEPEHRAPIRAIRDFRKQFGPRGVLRCKASDRDDPTDQPRWGKVGKQTIEDTGPLPRSGWRRSTTRPRPPRSTSSSARSARTGRSSAGSTRPACTSAPMCGKTSASKPGLTARTEYADGMIEHDGHDRHMLKKLDDLGIANDTIVLYTTDNGPHRIPGRTPAMTPFRSEKNTNWEGAFRVPCLIRWPGRIQPGSVSNEIVSGLDWLPTLVAAAGRSGHQGEAAQGHQAGGKTFKVHLDGYNQLPYLTGQQERSARKEFFYFNDDGDLVAMRYENWKIVFEEQRATGTLRIWAEPFTKLRVPKLFDLRADPYERADITSNTYYDWLHVGRSRVRSSPSQSDRGANFWRRFKEYPPQPAGGELQHRSTRREDAEDPGARRTSNDGTKPAASQRGRQHTRASSFHCFARHDHEDEQTDMRLRKVRRRSDKQRLKPAQHSSRRHHARGGSRVGRRGADPTCRRRNSGAAQPAPPAATAEHPRHLRRRYRRRQCQRLFVRRDGLPSTPNIDRIAREGMMFTDYYAEQSCTAGRSSFITGQATLRTGLSKVGLPGATIGLQPQDITIAEALKPLGYATGQFGKNHLGDRNEFLPTVHGFDEFFGNLYHLNAEEEPENPDYPKDPAFKAKFGPRGVIKCRATDRDDPTVDPRFGKVGKQTIEDTGPLTKKRMETIDDETTAAAIDFIERQVEANKPFFCWLNSTRMHLYTHVRPECIGQQRHQRICRRHARARRPRRQAPEGAGRSRHRRQHDRRLHAPTTART